MNTDPNAQAFPINERNGDGSHYTTSGGLTKREHCAAMIMSGALAASLNGVSVESMAEWSVCAADALIAALNNGALK